MGINVLDIDHIVLLEAMARIPLKPVTNLEIEHNDQESI